MSEPLPTAIPPTFHEKIWGSTELEPWFPPAEKKIGEVWFPPPPDIPILVKFLFTSERLSVQVHPKDDYARIHEHSAGKTEMWHILRAAPGAEIALGFRAPITRQRLRAAAESGEIEKLLRWIRVRAGESYLTPAGTVHAIGGGLALCEIQQFSDVTYRLYDYGRPRELHLDKAVEVADLGPHPGRITGDTVRSPYFVTETLHIVHEKPYVWHRPHLLILLEGEGSFENLPCRRGQVWHVDANAAFAVRPVTPMHLLRTSIPAQAVR